ncbi:hypothetical protein CA13_17310 [Planctomycetes bacterium CA13]|uniref:Uncharacterized protein n=1 Tax=Novipirellula herctigrandis TaxID=2527986 RepID=A0A5C5YYY6_9BACT|nr:hypothetical protein CA13_17310 [Planctomycetes bacterium CA13]
MSVSESWWKTTSRRHLNSIAKQPLEYPAQLIAQDKRRSGQTALRTNGDQDKLVAVEVAIHADEPFDATAYNDNVIDFIRLRFSIDQSRAPQKR